MIEWKEKSIIQSKIIRKKEVWIEEWKSSTKF